MSSTDTDTDSQAEAEVKGSEEYDVSLGAPLHDEEVAELEERLAAWSMWLLACASILYVVGLFAGLQWLIGLAFCCSAASLVTQGWATYHQG